MFQKNHSKGVHSRRKRHTKSDTLHKGITVAIFDYRHNGVQWRRKKKFTYQVNYKKYIHSYKEKLKQKLVHYRLIVKQKKDNILNKKLELLIIWQKRVEWLRKQKWEIWFRTIKDIDIDLWITRIKTIFSVVDQKKHELIDFIWNSWWNEIIIWYKEWINQYSKSQIEMIWRWKKFVTWLIDNKWETSFEKVDGVDKELWMARIRRIILIIEQRKFSQICDKDWLAWKVKIETWLEMINKHREDIFDNDSKRIAILQWKNRVEWIKNHHLMTIIKYGDLFANQRTETLDLLKQIIDLTDHYEVEKLSETRLLESWHKLKAQVEKVLKTIPNEDEDVKTSLEWINRMHWLEVNNVQHTLHLHGGEKDNTEYVTFTTMVKGREFSTANTKIMTTSFDHLKELVNKQKTSVEKELHDISAQRFKRSAINYFNIPVDNFHMMDLAESISALSRMTKNYPSLGTFLMKKFIELHSLAGKLDDEDIEPRQILFQKLIKDHIKFLQSLKLPMNFWLV